MVDVQPEQGAAQEKTPHFVPTVVEDEAIPVGVNPLARIGVLEKVGPIEETEPVLVIGKMRGHPIQDHADLVLMEAVDKVHEILG